MLIKSLIFDAIIMLNAQKLKNCLTIVSMLIGIGSLTILLTIHNNAQSNAKQTIETLGKDMMVVNLLNYKDDNFKAKSRKILLQDLAKLNKELDLTMILVPYKILYNPIRFRRNNITTFLVAIDNQVKSIFPFVIEQGRMLNSLDVNDKVIVLGATVAKKMANELNTPIINKLIQINGVGYKVVGVLKEIENHPILDFEFNNSIFVDLSMLTRFEYRDLDSFIIKTLENNNNNAQNNFRQVVEKLFGKKYFIMRSNEIFAKKFLDQAKAFNRILTWISIITLVIGAFSIMNILLMSVLQRKGEIGMRLSIGAVPKDVAYLFFMEGLIISVLGGVIGIILGQFVSMYILHNIGWAYTFHSFPLVIGFSVASIIGVLASMVPAIKVSRLHPVDLLVF